MGLDLDTKIIILCIYLLKFMFVKSTINLENCLKSENYIYEVVYIDFMYTVVVFLLVTFLLCSTCFFYLFLLTTLLPSPDSAQEIWSRR